MKNIALLTCLVMLTFSGCVVKKVTIQTNPEGANAYLNNADMGPTPLVQELKFRLNGEKIKYRLSLDGYQDTVLAIAYKPKNVTNYNVNLEKREVVFMKLISYEPIDTYEGSKLSRVIRISRAYLEQIERSPNVKSVTRITNMTDTSAQVGTIAISSDGEYLAYSIYAGAYEKATSNIWKMKIGNLAQTRITFGTKADLFPSFSGNNDYLYFSSNRNSPNTQIWRTAINGGGGLTKISTSENDDYFASVNRSGKTIVFNSKPMDGGDPEVWTINADGNLPTQLREGGFPVISPDGQKILFTRPDKSNLAIVGNAQFYPLQIWMMDIDGANETLLTQNTLYNCYQPSWSPFGDWVVYVSDEGLDTKGVGNNDIWAMKADGSEKTQLTTNGSWDDCPIWSRDDMIYFRSNRGGNWNIWRFKPNVIH
jgi:hypothetical protein